MSIRQYFKPKIIHKYMNVLQFIIKNHKVLYCSQCLINKGVAGIFVTLNNV